MKIIVQPYIPHYREQFINGLMQHENIVIYCYEPVASMQSAKFKESTTPVTHLSSFQIGPFLFYNPFKLLRKDCDTLILMLSFVHISTWFLLLTKPLHRKKIILWGHGISIKRYVEEYENVSKLLKWMIILADHIWFYTEHELNLWKKHIKNLKAISLNNTISGIDKILLEQKTGKENLKLKYKITQKRVLIFCARFNIQARRIDLLYESMTILDPENYGFIIIGDGPLKPDYNHLPNVYDFGSLYDVEIKSELFRIADIYFQPGWVGLSIVEAMAYGKPIFTFRRSVELLQCVEYYYIQNGINGLIFDNINEFVLATELLKDDELGEMGKNAIRYVNENLKIENMVTRALNSLSQLNEQTRLN